VTEAKAISTGVEGVARPPIQLLMVLRLTPRVSASSCTPRSRTRMALRIRSARSNSRVAAQLFSIVMH
jgi:hypothetical protein